VSGPLGRAPPRAAAAPRQALARSRKPLERRVASLEADIARFEREKAQLEAKLASASFYQSGDQDEVAAALREQAKIASALEKAEAEWLDLQAQLEEIGRRALS
jgi:ATP-binding cassette subfamily F protein 3